MARYVEDTPIDVLIPYDKNPRIITQTAVDAVARSIAAFDFNEPIIADADGVILAGHNRLKAARQLGMQTVPVLWVEDIDMQRARAYRIADNRTAEIATWDRSLLDQELAGILRNADADIDALGVEQWELDRLTKDADKPADDGFLPDRLYKKKTAFSTDDVERPPETQPKAKGRPLAPPSIRILIVIETDEDKAAMRHALDIPEDKPFPAVIRFSEVKT